LKHLDEIYFIERYITYTEYLGEDTRCSIAHDVGEVELDPTSARLLVQNWTHFYLSARNEERSREGDLGR
jgi:hypothetical protein